MHSFVRTVTWFAVVLAWLPAASTSVYVGALSAQSVSRDLNQDRSLREALSDARRLSLITDAREREPGTLQLTIGPAFSTSTSTKYNLSRLYLTYAAFEQNDDGPTVLELLENDEKIGEYTKDGLRLSREPTTRATASSTPNVAAAPSSQGKWYAAVGTGGGAADFTCETCFFERSSALSGYVMVGRRVSERAVLGLEATGWSKSDDVSRGQLYSITATALGYFDDNLPLFVSGGIGYAGYRRRIPAGNLAADAVGYSVRLGSKFHLKRRLGLAPYLGLAGSFGSPEFTFADGTPYGLSANFSNLQFGAALIFE